MSTAALPADALTGHRITSVDSAPLRSRYPRTIGRNARLGAHGDGPEALAITVRTDTGASGWGIYEGPEPDLGACIGLPLEEIFDPAVGVIAPRALPLDIALHDLAATILGIPVHRMLGGHGALAVDCYSGAIYFDDLDPEQDPRGTAGVLASCAADWEAGYRAFKLKIGRGNRWMPVVAGFDRDLEVLQAVRTAYPEARLMVDMNDGYSPEQTVRFLDTVQEWDLFWIEEPFAEHRSGLALVREHLTRNGSEVLVADGEFEPDVGLVLDLAREGLLDVLLMDVLSFGFTAWRRLMPTVHEIGAVASPHAWGHPLKTLYAAQLAAGLGNIDVVESVPGTTDGVDASAYRLQDGRITLPATPGFALELSG